MSEVGKVWLVGAGPGDPSLITLRGLRVLEGADVVLYDALSHPALLEHCRAGADLRHVGKRAGERYPPQRQITDQLIELARQGKRVVRLKGGDPFIFARGSEEASDLAAARIPFEIVPGLSSPVATSAYAGIPLTHRDLSSSVTFITGSDAADREWSAEAWHKLATATETLCVLMGMRHIERITRALVDGGRSGDTPAAVVQWGARPEQKVLTATLETIAVRSKEEGLSNPAVIIVGDVVSLREKLRWFDTQPLFGKRILVPRPAHQAQETANAIRERAAEPVVFPVIEISDPSDPEPLRRAALELSNYDWVLFTSSNGVDKMFEELRRHHRDARAFGSARVGAIGPKTAAALTRRGITADLVAREFVGEDLAREVGALGPIGRVLIPRAAVAREALPELLRKAGAEVDVVAAYETHAASKERAAELARWLDDGEIDVVTFTSSSTVDSVVDSLGDRAPELLGKVTTACIGPITEARLLERGLGVTVSAAQFTVAGLLDALEEHFGGDV